MKEGDDLTLMCQPSAELLDMQYLWIITSNITNTSVIISQNQIYQQLKVTVSDAGDYTCQVTNGTVTVEETIAVEIVRSLYASGGSQGELANEEELVPIFGFSGAVFFIFMVITALVVMRRARNKKINKIDTELGSVYLPRTTKYTKTSELQSFKVTSSVFIYGTVSEGFVS